MVEFTLSTAGGIVLVLLLVVLGGTLTSPMSTSTKAMVGVGLVVFGLVTFYVGIRHGEYRASHTL